MRSTNISLDDLAQHFFYFKWLLLCLKWISPCCCSWKREHLLSSKIFFDMCKTLQNSFVKYSKVGQLKIPSPSQRQTGQQWQIGVGLTGRFKLLPCCVFIIDFVHCLCTGWLSWFGNSLVMFVLYRQRATLQPTDFLTLNLAISDASISVFGYSRGILEIFNIFRDNGYLITWIWTCQVKTLLDKVDESNASAPFFSPHKHFSESFNLSSNYKSFASTVFGQSQLIKSIKGDSQCACVRVWVQGLCCSHVGWRLNL